MPALAISSLEICAPVISAPEISGPVNSSSVNSALVTSGPAISGLVISGLVISGPVNSGPVISGPVACGGLAASARPGDRAGQQSAIEVEASGHYRDRRCRRAADPQLRDGRADPDLTVTFGPHGASTDQDHVGETAQHGEDQPVSRTRQPARLALHRGGAIDADDHVRPNPRPVADSRRLWVGVNDGQFVDGASGSRSVSSG